MRDKIKDVSKKTAALFIAAVLVLCTGGIMAAKAALNVVSPAYDAELDLAKVMDITILEGSGDSVSDAGATEAVLNAFKMSDGKTVNVSPGKVYDETLAIKNNSSRPMYVRMIVRKYWKDEKGNKATYADGEIKLDPKFIKLTYKGSAYNSDSWIKSAGESTDECNVYYYKSILTGTTDPLFDGVSLDRSVMDEYTTSSEKNNGKNVITYEYKYDKCSICLEAEAQAVQTHNAEDAIRSIWGVDATLSGGSIQSIK